MFILVVYNKNNSSDLWMRSKQRYGGDKNFIYVLASACHCLTRTSHSIEITTTYIFVIMYSELYILQKAFICAKYIFNSITVLELFMQVWQLQCSMNQGGLISKLNKCM